MNFIANIGIRRLYYEWGIVFQVSGVTERYNYIGAYIQVFEL